MKQIFLSLVFVMSSATVVYSQKADEKSTEVKISSEYVTPKEGCGIEASKKEVEFYHKQNIIKDLVKFTFTDNGGFILYNEDGINHTWEVDADALTITRTQLTTGFRKFIIYNLESSPRSSGGTTVNSNTQPIDWTDGFVQLIHEIVSQENFLYGGRDTSAEVKLAMNCAHKILINAVARAQERYLVGKTVIHLEKK